MTGRQASYRPFVVDLAQNLKSPYKPKIEWCRAGDASRF
jgi:hypothetical protein